MIRYSRGVVIEGDRVRSLADAVKRAYQKIEDVSDAMLAQGFPFNGLLYPTNPGARANMMDLLPYADILPYPIPWSTVDYVATTIKSAEEFKAFHYASVSFRAKISATAVPLRDAVAKIVASDESDNEKIAALDALDEIRQLDGSRVEWRSVG